MIMTAARSEAAEITTRAPLAEIFDEVFRVLQRSENCAKREDIIVRSSDDPGSRLAST
jgi:hypothetical protein